jgi:hypothetical protein
MTFHTANVGFGMSHSQFFVLKIDVTNQAPAIVGYGAFCRGGFWFDLGCHCGFCGRLIGRRPLAGPSCKCAQDRH